MRNKQIIRPKRNFPNKWFSVIAVFALIAFLMTLKPVAKVVSDVLNMVGVPAAVEVVQNTAANMMLMGVGALLIMLAPLVVITSVMVAVWTVGVVLFGVGLFNVYKTFSGKPTQEILPTAINRQ